MGLILCTSSCGNQNKDDKTNFDEKLAVEKLGSQLMSTWENGDVTHLENIFHHDVEYVDIPNNHVFKGIEEVKSYISHIHSWGSNIQMNIRSTEYTNENGYIEWTMTAKQTSPIKGKVEVATNKDIVINGVTLIETKDGLIIKATDYLDALGFVLQLGSKVELPGGVTIGGN